MIEFLPWYQAGNELVRCEGDDGCGSLLTDGDTEKHLKWHKRIEKIENRLNFPEHHARVLGTEG